MEKKLQMELEQIERDVKTPRASEFENLDTLDKDE